MAPWRRRGRDSRSEAAAPLAPLELGFAAPTRFDSEPVLIVGLGNPGSRYAKTRHNAGFEVATILVERWRLGKQKQRFRGLISDGHSRPGGPRVTLLLPQTFMNESGRSAGPLRGELRIGPERVVCLHDEIDLPFGEVRAKQGGGVAGHNGLKSLKREFASGDFWRLRVGVGRPASSDPEIVSAWVLGRFAEPPNDVLELFERAADEAERLVERVAGSETNPEEQ